MFLGSKENSRVVGDRDILVVVVMPEERSWMGLLGQSMAEVYLVCHRDDHHEFVVVVRMRGLLMRDGEQQRC